MKLAQRVVLHYYKNKLNLLASVSPRKAAEAAFKLFCTPYSKRKVLEMPPVFKHAKKLSFAIAGETVNGYQWTSSHPNSRKVLICHGFDSHSYKFDKFIDPLLSAGFEVFAFDAPGHGTSSGRTLNAGQYRDVILHVHNAFGPVDGLIAHSLGGLSASLAVEAMAAKAPKRLVLIAPATETKRAVATFFKYLPVKQVVRDEMEKLIYELGGVPSEWYSVARIVQHTSLPTLWVHDELDQITPFADMQHLLELNLPHVQFEITNGLGHSLYRDKDVQKKIIQFLQTMITQ